MILTHQIAQQVADGTVTLAFRRWKNLRVAVIFRIALTWLAPDERSDLASNSSLTADDVAEIEALINRLDARTPWAQTTLVRISESPGITAATLAADLPFTKESLKRRIRTLKEHGLTRSLQVGYEVSERGRAFLDASAD